MQTKHLLLMALATTFVACHNDSKPKEEPEVPEISEYKDTTIIDCTAPSSWFQQVGGTRDTPPPNEGPTSVFANNQTVRNCDFHKWSWQKFLWLTNEVNGQPLFLDSLKQVSSIGQVLTNPNGIVLTDTAQASYTEDILRTPEYSLGTPPATTVYYGIFMDDLLYNTMVTYAPLAKNHPDSVEHITYPVGALEVKSAWVDVTGLDPADTSSYFITNGVINGTNARVALLGMHVVGIVENHPEFVWATFEHDGLAPHYDWGQATNTSDAPVVATVDYPLFNKDSTGTVRNITSKLNQSTPNNFGTDVFSVYKFGTPVEKNSNNVEVFMKTSQKGDENFGNIEMLNGSVKNQLTGIWNNYFYNGSLWINTEGYVGTVAQANLLDSLGFNLSSSDTGDLTRGSVAAYNITMETYVQVGFSPTSIHQTTVSDLANCFSCHSASNSGNQSPLYISHVFTGYLQNLQGFDKTEIKQNHVDEIRAHFEMRKNQ